MTLAQSLRHELSARANPEKARAMQSYMKSAMPYYGVNLPELRAISNRVFAEYPLASCGQWHATSPLESQLSGLSRREVLKNFTSAGVPASQTREGEVARRTAAGRMGSAGADV